MSARPASTWVGLQRHRSTRLGLAAAVLSVLLAGRPAAAAPGASAADVAGVARASGQTTVRSATPAGNNNLLDHAIETYLSAQQTEDRDLRLQMFEKSARLFVAAAESGPASAELWANAGTAALQAERLGDAVLYLRRALAIDPNLRRARQNLEHARGLLPKWVPLPHDHRVLDDFLGARLTREERHGLASLAFLLAALLAAAGIARRNGLARSMALLPLAVWALLLGSSLLTSREAAAREAVVVVEVPAHAADSFNAPLRFADPLPAGTEVTVETERARWARVLLADGQDAWLPRSAITPIGE